ncbi:MAG: DUF2975 domain-containing protein [Bacillota bacterium]
MSELKNNKVLKAAMVFITILLGGGVVFLAMSLYGSITDYISGKQDSGFMYAAFSALGIIFAYLMYLLRSITKSALNRQPFTMNNVKSFRKIGATLLAISFIDIILNYGKSSGTRIIDINSVFIVTPDTLLIMILSCIAFVLAEVFRAAVEIKNENDLTI